ncbi:MAG: outer membrane beta-barrel protein [Fimbriimonas sp.]|nr:outer membrane beta-barrel protein [Fimbriimonas sp.]
MQKLAVIGSLGLLATVSAQAQTNPLSLRLGYSWLPNLSTADITGSHGYTVGLGYDLPGIPGIPFKLSVDADYSIHNGHGNDLHTGSLMLVGRTAFPGMGNGKGPGLYYGLGLGVLRNSTSYSTTVVGGSGTTTSKTSSTTYTGGAEILLGLNVNANSQVELSYRISPSSSGVQPTSLGLVYAYHF